MALIRQISAICKKNLLCIIRNKCELFKDVSVVLISALIIYASSKLN